MSIEKRTGNEIPRPTLGKTHRSNRWARFVDLNDYADKIVDFANSTFVPAPANPSNGDTLVYNSKSGEWESKTVEVERDGLLTARVADGNVGVGFNESNVVDDNNEVITPTLTRVEAGFYTLTFGDNLKSGTELVVISANSTNGIINVQSTDLLDGKVINISNGTEPSSDFTGFNLTYRQVESPAPPKP